MKRNRQMGVVLPLQPETENALERWQNLEELRTGKDKIKMLSNE